VIDSKSVFEPFAPWKLGFSVFFENVSPAVAIAIRTGDERVTYPPFSFPNETER